ncbi:MAG: biotin/lipoyl-binding protein [Alphaproteobacteria bacterium]|jgi:RND family efflux transporter MFP subunit|nr:biotin/lipoyl-binding protein [Alphaproteobacteria bacterium]MBT7942067.1 biotin/lipoyl-binding protein [Alphaproteobacteria bacterium]
MRAFAWASVLATILIAAPTPGSAAERKLAFPVAGVIAKVMVRSGQTVKAGATLATLDQVPLKARKEAADADLRAADRKLTFATQNRNRAKQLFDDLSTSAEELERAEIALIEAIANKVRSRANADIAAWNLKRATLRAPTNATVQSVPGYPGMVVNPTAAITPVVVLSGP